MAIFARPDVERLRASGDVPGLGKALRHRDAEIRAAAAGALGLIGDEAAVAPLCGALGDRVPAVRAAAAGALGLLGSPSALDALARGVGDDDVAVRRAVARALGLVGGRAAIPSLASMLGDQDADVRFQAAQALGLIADPEAVEPLAALAADPSQPEEVQAAAANALDHIPGGQAAATRTRQEASVHRDLAGAEAAAGARRNAFAAAVTGVVAEDEARRRHAHWALDRLAATDPDLLLDALASRRLGWREEGALATALVGEGVDLDDRRLGEVLRVLRETAAGADVVSEGTDEDWKDRSGSWLRGPERAAAAALQERLVARWASQGTVSELAALPVDEVRSRLFEALEAPVHWRTRGQVVALLVEHGEDADDPRFASTLDEVRAAAALRDQVVERDLYWTETTVWADQREAARSILRAIGEAAGEDG